MKKIMIIGTVAVLILGIGLFIFQKKNTPEGTQVTSDTTEQSVSYNPVADTATPEQQALRNQVKEKIQNNTIETSYSSTPGAVLVDKYPPEVSPAKNPDYDTLFYPETNTFDMMLYAFPLEETRKRAGKYLAETLGVSEQELCQLKIFVGVSPSTSSSLAGKNLGLSSCPGNTDLSVYTENIDGSSNIQE